MNTFRTLLSRSSAAPLLRPSFGMLAAILATSIADAAPQDYGFTLAHPVSQALAAAEPIEWQDDVDGNFGDGTKWVGGFAPSSSDAALFPNFETEFENAYTVNVPKGEGPLASSILVYSEDVELRIPAPAGGGGSVIFAGANSEVGESSLLTLSADDEGEGGSTFSFTKLTLNNFSELSAEGIHIIVGEAGLNLIGATAFVTDVTGPITIDEGSLLRGLFGTFDEGLIQNGGELVVSGMRFNNGVVNNGAFRIGQSLEGPSIGEAEFFNDDAVFTQTDSGSLYIDIRGTLRGETYDGLVGISDGGEPSANLKGTLILNFVEFTPTAGQEFFVFQGFHGGISGTFTSVEGLPPGWIVEYRDTDGDEDVDDVVIRAAETEQSIVPGIYTGFLMEGFGGNQPANRRAGTSGILQGQTVGLVRITAATKRALTGVVLLDGSKYSFIARFPQGNTWEVVARAHTAPPIRLRITLVQGDFQVEVISGHLSQGLAVKSPYNNTQRTSLAGFYNLVLPAGSAPSGPPAIVRSKGVRALAADGPTGHGYGYFYVGSNGITRYAGRMGDAKTSFAGTTAIQPGDRLPVWMIVPAVQTVSGTLTFADEATTDLAGSLSWSTPDFDVTLEASAARRGTLRNGSVQLNVGAPFNFTGTGTLQSDGYAKIAQAEDAQKPIASNSVVFNASGTVHGEVHNQLRGFPFRGVYQPKLGTALGYGRANGVVFPFTVTGGTVPPP